MISTQLTVNWSSVTMTRVRKTVKAQNSNLEVDMEMMIRWETVVRSEAMELIVYRNCLRTLSLRALIRISWVMVSAQIRNAGHRNTMKIRKHSRTKKRLEEYCKISTSTSCFILLTLVISKGMPSHLMRVVGARRRVIVMSSRVPTSMGERTWSRNHRIQHITVTEEVMMTTWSWVTSSLTLSTWIRQLPKLPRCKCKAAQAPPVSRIDKMDRVANAEETRETLLIGIRCSMKKTDWY